MGLPIDGLSSINIKNTKAYFSITNYIFYVLQGLVLTIRGIEIKQNRPTRGFQNTSVRKTRNINFIKKL